MSHNHRRTAALLALFLLASVLTTTTAGAATPPADGETVPFEEAFTVAEGDGSTGYGFPDISSDPVTGRSLVVYNYALDVEPDGVNEESQVRARVIGNDGVIGPEFQIDTTLSTDGFFTFDPPSAAWNSTHGEWLVTWTDDAVIFGQIVDSDGSLIGDNFVIAASKMGVFTDGDNLLGDIEHTRAEWSPADGVYVVTFKARGRAGGVVFDQTILATVIDETGTPVLDGDVVDVSEETANDGVTISYSTTSDVWLIGWERQDVSELPGARIVSVSMTGVDMYSIDFDSGVLAVSTSGAGPGGTPESTWDSTRDRFIVVWRATQAGDPTAQHYYNFVAPDGSFDEADEAQIGPDVTDMQRRARVAYSPYEDEYAVVAHRQGIEVGPDPEVNELLSWTINGDGTGAAESEVITSVGDRRARPIVAYGGGCFRYVWWDLGQHWDGGGLPDSVNAYIGCRGCYVFDPGSDTFTDVVVDAFYDVPVGWLVHKELTTGTSPTTYEPDRGVTRGEFATFLHRFEGLPDAPLGSATFLDVMVGRFYDKAIGWLFEAGITTGTSPITFDPERTLTRGELATFLWRFAGMPDAPLGSATFTDVDPARFYDKAVGWLFQEGITTGTSPTTFDPERTLTRGEMATFLFRFAKAVRCMPA